MHVSLPFVVPTPGGDLHGVRLSKDLSSRKMFANFCDFFCVICDLIVVRGGVLGPPQCYVVCWSCHRSPILPGRRLILPSLARLCVFVSSCFSFWLPHHQARLVELIFSPSSNKHKHQPPHARSKQPETPLMDAVRQRDCQEAGRWCDW